jgi:GNAT superfamily N-acetyltransferase
MVEWIIERLGPAHMRAEFSCCRPQLDEFLRTLVTQYERRGIGRTFVARAPEQMRVAGYYTLAAGSFDVGLLPAAARKKLPKHVVPTVHLGRLAVDQAFRGQRLGEVLLMHALQAALRVSQTVGACAVDVWSIDDNSRGFYQKYGFVALADKPSHLYLQTKSLQKTFTS